GIAVLTLALGIGSSWVTSRGLRRVTGDYGADELSSMLDFYSSVLKAVSEGLLLVDRSRGIVLINSEARELLGLTAGEDDADPAPASAVGAPPTEAATVGTPLDDLDLPGALLDLLASGRGAPDAIHNTDDPVLVATHPPTEAASATWVVTVRDPT